MYRYRKARYTLRNIVVPLLNNKINFLLQLVQYLFLQPLKVLINAEVAHLVEHDLAKVGVAGSSPVFRSDGPALKRDFF
jgi:hypothetical protein